MKKILRKLTGLFLVFLMSFSALSPVILAFSEPGKVEINKTAKKIGDEKTSRKAEVTLSVKGNSFSVVSKTDIVLVLDRSGSMDDALNGAAKRITAMEAANKLVDSLITDQTKDHVKIAVVPFGTSVGKVTNLTSDKSVIKSAITNTYNSQIGSNGTNVQAGLKKANDILSGLDSNKIVILLSDGIPTYYNDPNYGVVGTGSDDSVACLEYGFLGFSCRKEGIRPSEAAIEVANTLKGNNTSIYTVGFGDIDSDTVSFLKSVSSDGKYYSAFDTVTLNNAFKDIVKDTFAIATDVVVSDIVPEGFIVDEDALKKTYGDAVTISYIAKETLLTWNIDKLNSNEVSELKYQVTAKDGYYGSMYTNKEATISGTPVDGNPYYNGKFTHTFPKPSITIPGITNDDNYGLDNNYIATVGMSLYVPESDGLLKNDLLDIEMIEDADSVSNRIIVNKEGLCGDVEVNQVTGEFTYTPNSTCVNAEASKNVSFTYFVETSIIKNGIETTVRSNTSTVTIKVVKKQTTYKVRYLEENTNKALAEEKNVNGYVGDTVSENAVEIKGYDRVSVPTKSLELKEENNVIDFFYRKKDAKVFDNKVSKTGTISIDRKDINVDYEINYQVSIEDYMGDAKVTIIDTLPYMIDALKSDLDGGIYDASNNTITWTEDIKNIDTYENGNKLVNITKNISVLYLGIDITADTLENKVDGQIKLDDVNVIKVSDSAQTNININGNLKVYYVDKNGNELLKTEEYTKKAGTLYETSEEQIDGYELVNVTGEEKGSYNDSLIEVIYTYDRVKALVSEENTKVSKTGTKNITSKEDKMNYNITYHTEIDKYIGNGKLVVKDTLPYKIDTTKEYDLNGGTYNEEENTITWIIDIKDVNTYENGVKKIDFDKSVSLYYKDINIEADKITNHVKTTLSLETIDDVVNEDSFDTDVEINGKLIVKYVDKEDNELIKTKETVKKAGTLYETVKEDIKDYNFVKVIGNESGKYNDEVTEVKYVYERKQAKVTEDKIVKTGNVEITSSNLSVDYKINYQANIEDYMGDAKVTIIDTLPYMIDALKSNLDGGIYDANNNTITWTEDIKNIDTYENGNKKIDITKNIKVYYLGIDITSSSLINKVEGKLDIETAKVNPMNDEFETNVNINGNLVVRYVDENDKDLLPMVRQEQKAGTNYETRALKIDGYTLKEVIGNQVGKYTEDVITVTYVYERTLTKYNVKYLEKDTNKELLQTKTKTGYVNDKVTEKAALIDGYKLSNDDSITIVLDEENNEIIFYYDKVLEVAKVVSTGINDSSNPYYLFMLMCASILGCLVYYKKKTL